MLAMAQVNGRVAVRDPDAVINEIERTREDLAHTIDALTDRVSPGNVARHTLGEVREQLSRPQVRLAAGAAILITVAAVGFALWRRSK
jgi:alpha-D-ribose 1-methylphosphonate 5-triphosphate diphosphatase PhnM